MAFSLLPLVKCVLERLLVESNEFFLQVCVDMHFFLISLAFPVVEVTSNLAVGHLRDGFNGTSLALIHRLVGCSFN